jgi:hypothetical protein
MPKHLRIEPCASQKPHQFLRVRHVPVCRSPSINDVQRPPAASLKRSCQHRARRTWYAALDVAIMALLPVGPRFRIGHVGCGRSYYACLFQPPAQLSDCHFYSPGFASFGIHVIPVLKGRILKPFLAELQRVDQIVYVFVGHFCATILATHAARCSGVSPGGTIWSSAKRWRTNW